MISTMAFQLMEGATIEELDKAGLGGHFTQFNHALFPADPNGIPFTSAYIATTGDYIADLESDMASEETITFT